VNDFAGVGNGFSGYVDRFSGYGDDFSAPVNRFRGIGNRFLLPFRFAFCNGCFAICNGL
jgi:hypothetical protein